MGKFSRVWSWVRLLMGLLGLAALFTLVDLQDVRAAIAEADLRYLIPASLLLLLSTMVKSYRWLLLLRRHDGRLSFWRLFGTYMIGTFYSQFLPGAAAGGDAMRMAETSVDTGRTADAVSSVMIERAIGLMTVLSSASLILLLRRNGDIPLELTLVVHTLSVLGLLALIVLRFGWFLGPLVRLLERLRLAKIALKLSHLSSALQGDLGQGRILAQMVVLSLLANFLSMTAYYLCMVAVGDHASYLSFIALAALIVTLEALPLTPGALGVREGAYVFFLGILGVSEYHALTIGLLVRVITWAQALAGGLVLLERGIRRRSLNQVQPSASIEPS